MVNELSPAPNPQMAAAIRPPRNPKRRERRARHSSRRLPGHDPAISCGPTATCTRETLAAVADAMGAGSSAVVAAQQPENEGNSSVQALSAVRVISGGRRDADASRSIGLPSDLDLSVGLLGFEPGTS